MDNDTAVRYTKCKGGEAMREKKDINIEIGGNIQVAREQAGYTQDTLSEMLGIEYLDLIPVLLQHMAAGNHDVPLRDSLVKIENGSVIDNFHFRN